MNCTGIAASWCPKCGTCACPRNDDGVPIDGLDDDACPLHSPRSKHADKKDH